MSKITFEIEHAYEYKLGEGKYPYTKEELKTAVYVLTLNNGDSHLCNRLTDVLEVVNGELWLAGFED